MNKKVMRLNRAKKTRRRISELNMNRLCIFRSNKHIYAQLINSSGDSVLASISTLDPDIRNKCKTESALELASIVGKKIAERALVLGITHVAFDRSGFKYHGRIKVLADAARNAGLKF